MNVKLAKRMDSLSPSMTMAISALAADLKASGKDILSFSAGEPDFGTPIAIKDAAVEALEKELTKYTAVAGTNEVKTAIANKLKRDNNLSYEPSDIMTNVGAKHGLFNIFQALIDEGDEVIIPAPYWVTYPELVKYSEGIPVAITTDDSTQFKITPEQLQNAITPKTKMLILTTPSNPTGSVYSKDELTQLAKVLEGTDIWVVSDEMYEKLVYDGLKFTATASINDDMFKRTITVNGLSKATAMTGWRFGYLATPNKEVIKAMTKLQSQSTSNINTLTQHASITALEGKVDDVIEMMRGEFEKRRDLACELINKIEGLSVVKPQGAFYLYINIKNITTNSMEFSTKLLEDAGVAVVPGIAFGLDGYFRFSFATDVETIKQGISRIADFVKNYK